MARKLRLEYEGACYHVINRGNYRKNVFEAKGAAEAFERCLGETCERFGWVIHAYVIMSNHFHLAVETPQPNLSEGMKFLQGTWANRFNRFNRVMGRPFQGRYKALHVEPGHALAQVAHYIHLNPVRAKVVESETLGEFRWSSLSWFLEKKGRPAWLCAETVLAEAGGLADTEAGWRKYGEYLAVLAETMPRKREERYAHLLCGPPKTEESASVEPKTGSPAVLAGQGNRIEALEAEVASLRAELGRLWQLTGLTDRHGD